MSDRERKKRERKEEDKSKHTKQVSFDQSMDHFFFINKMRRFTDQGHQVRQVCRPLIQYLAGVLSL